MRMQIANIEIPPTLNCNGELITINNSQIQNSQFSIGLAPSRNRAQITFLFDIHLFPAQQAGMDCLMALPDSVDCDVMIIEVFSNVSSKVKAQLSFSSGKYTLKALI
jgi:hypothetical protein